MLKAIKMEVKPEEIIKPVKKMKKGKGRHFWRPFLPLRLRNILGASKKPGPIIRPEG